MSKILENNKHFVHQCALRYTRHSVFEIYRKKVVYSIYHFLINLSSGMGEWYMKVVYNSFDS